MDYITHIKSKNCKEIQFVFDGRYGDLLLILFKLSAKKKTCD